jgi:hypothetical protein
MSEIQSENENFKTKIIELEKKINKAKIFIKEKVK